MRLINADELKALLAEDEITVPMIDDVPTVKAIPVSFIRNRITQLYSFVATNGNDPQSKNMVESCLQEYCVLDRLLRLWAAERKEE